jgi:5-(carboxyamino)imidazole ribonucleotide synthase
MKPILPGRTIGVIGGGQLGRMLTLEAHRMGYRVCIFDPTPHCSAAQVADFHVCASFTDRQAMQEFISLVDVITVETEHAPVSLLTYLETHRPLRPSAQVIGVIQDRLTQKEFLSAQGFPQVQYVSVTDEESLIQAAKVLDFPAILKSRRSGYDGKGQVRVACPAALRDAWEQLGCCPSVLETVASLRTEISVILARSLDGQVRIYPLAENLHQQQVLRTTRAPAPLPSAMRLRAEMIALGIAGALDYCGVLAVEMFLLRNASLLVNEIAPRVHNSGHFTFGACATSQFEQHLRAICGLPLGDPALLRPAVMVNLFGDLWRNGEPNWEAVLAHPHAQLHLYGKAEVRAGRKMGHILLLDGDANYALRLLSQLCTEQHTVENQQEKISSY